MPSFLHHRLHYVCSASPTILWHLVKSILDGSLYLGSFFVRDTGKVACDNMAFRWIQKWRVRTRARRLNRTTNIRNRSDLVVVKNDRNGKFVIWKLKSYHGVYSYTEIPSCSTMIILSQSTKLWRLYWFQHGCLSWERWFLQSLNFLLTYNDDISHIS